ncbi:hypothetical protein NDU88_004890 [Pleurodeles waltl]|uniref:Uncharacterized protein n=1 Tax=Pleurodeles waltl TaxID=8319 RepID=A0AAV7QD89_PLEWA|nr:hypothetical protein NDU88_004890 [Pleurodeles waltl]
MDFSEAAAALGLCGRHTPERTTASVAGSITGFASSVSPESSKPRATKTIVTTRAVQDDVSIQRGLLVSPNGASYHRGSQRNDVLHKRQPQFFMYGIARCPWRHAK